MKIREEIKELRVYYKSLSTPESVETFDDVLSILDKHLGECVVKQSLTNKYNIESIRQIVLDGLLRDVRLNHGDYISIYVRRK